MLAGLLVVARVRLPIVDEQLNLERNGRSSFKKFTCRTVALGAAQHGSQRQASRTRAQKPAGESVFWLAVGKAAAGHGCYFTQQWHDCRVRAAAGEMAETSGAATGASDLLVVGPGVLGRSVPFIYIRCTSLAQPREPNLRSLNGLLVVEFGHPGQL